MKSGLDPMRSSLITLSIVGVLSSLSTASQALGWESGDWSVTFDSNFSLGTSIRVEDRDMALIGNSNQLNLDWTAYHPVTNPLYSSADIWALNDASYSTNGDLSDLNYDSGKSFSTLFKGLHELDVSYKSMGLFLRGMYFYDFEMKDKARVYSNPLSGVRNDPCAEPRASDELCSDIRLLDAFFYSDFNVADVPVTLRIGDQVISWGESTFIQHGINTTNPADVSRSQAPGAELKEVFIPVGLIFASFGITDNLSLSMYYQYEWERSRLPQAGSYFSTNDFIGEGGQANNIQLGFSGNPDIDLAFLLDGLNELGTALGAGGDPAQIAQAYLAYATKVALRGYGDSAHYDADNQGQYGFKVSYFSEALNQTEFSFYHINYHSQRPLISGVTSDFTATGISQDLAYLALNKITKDNVTELGAFTQARFIYPEDIKLYGFSFNTSIGETALAGEMALRLDEPLQIDDVELLYAGMPEQLAYAGLRPDFEGISQLDSYQGFTGPGQTADGFILSDTLQMQVTASHVFGPTLGTDNLILLGEIGYIDIQDMPDPEVLRLNGPGTARSGPLQATADGNPRTGLHIGLSNGPETNPFPTASAWGYRLLALADYNNVFAGINVQARATFAHDVNGITPDPLFLFIEERKSASVSLTFDYLSKWQATLGYNTFWGGVGTTNSLSDRDFVSFAIKYSI